MTHDDDKPFWRHGLPECRHILATPVRVPSGVREQCPVCGKLDSVRLRLTDHLGAFPANDDKAKRWANARVEAGRAAMVTAQKKFVIKKAARKAENQQWFDLYGDFLKNPAWASMRSFVLARDGARCQASLPGCTVGATQVHHKAYALHRAIGMQPAFDLVAVCKFCHEKITEGERSTRK